MLKEHIESCEKFTQRFGAYASPGDKLSVVVEGFTITATIELDTCAGRPDELNQGFWPSLDPKSPGYIGDGKTEKDLIVEKQIATFILEEWEREHWFYCGIVLSVAKNGITFERNAASLWSIECNFPKGDNRYLTDVANELIPEALAIAKRTLTTLCNQTE